MKTRLKPTLRSRDDGSHDERSVSAARRVSRYSICLEFRLSELQQRVAALETRVEERFRECFGRFDAVYRRLERLEQEHQAIVEALRRLEALWGSDRAQREVIERDLAELRERVALLQARLDDLERRLGA
jgi:chromosome segregation ATPase